MRGLLERHARLRITPFYDKLEKLIAGKEHYITEGHGTGRVYEKLLCDLPDIRPSRIDLAADKIRIGCQTDIDAAQKKQLFKVLLRLRPWRKGPFNLFGMDVDSEWASHLKWKRLQDHIRPLVHRRILDIGSSNGYYLFRMAAADPEMVLGIEPFVLYYYQYRLLQHFIRAPQVFCLAAKLEEMPLMKRYFDTIFCMGMLYHRKSPIDTLREIHAFLRKNGELVLETLTIEGSAEVALCPRERYARMHNVFFLPTIACLINWLQRSGFKNIRHIDTTRTTLKEQCKTDWILSKSLENFLDPKNPDQTVEGYPAPQRSILIAEAGY